MTTTKRIIGSAAVALAVALAALSLSGRTSSAQGTPPPGLARVAHDSSMTGSGTVANPLKAAAAVNAGSALTGYNGLGSAQYAALGDITGVTAGDGMTGGGTTGALTLDVVGATGGGVTVTANALGLLTSCTDGQLLKWTAGSTSWGCASDTSGTGDITDVLAGTGISVTSSSGPQPTVNLANTAVTPGSYTFSSLTVDAQGRLTAASSGTEVGDLSGLTAGTGISITAATGPVPTINVADTAVTPGSYTFSAITVDQQGRLTSASSGTETGDLSALTAGTGITITSATGPVPTVNVADTAVTPGTYNFATITVDQQGRLTAASTGTEVGDITGVTAGVGLTGGGTTGALTLDVACTTGMTCNANDIALANTAVTPASYTFTSLTVDQQGRITAASNGTEVGDISAVTAGAGLTGGGTTGAITVDAVAVTGGGLVVNTNDIGLIDCGSGAVLKAGVGTGDWSCDVDNNSGGTVTGTGTAGTVAQFLTASSIGNTLATVTAGTFTVTANVADLYYQLVNSASGGRQYWIGTGATASTIPNSFYVYDVTGSAVVLRADSGQRMHFSAGAIYTTGDNTLGAAFGTNATATFYQNYYGYNGGTTQFRDWVLADGKGAGIISVTGSTKVSAFLGDVTVATAFSHNGNGTYGDATTDAHSMKGAFTHTETVGTDFTSMTNGNILVYDDTAEALGVGGSIDFGAKYDTNLTWGGRIKLMKVNSTSGQFGYDLAFGARPNGGGTMPEYMRIMSTGEIKFGDATLTTGVYTKLGTINFNWGDNASSTGVVNAYGYQGGTSQYRSFRVDNGNGSSIARFNGSTLLTEIFGGLTVTGAVIGNGAWTIGDAVGDTVTVNGATTHNANLTTVGKTFTIDSSGTPVDFLVFDGTSATLGVATFKQTTIVLTGNTMITDKSTMSTPTSCGTSPTVNGGPHHFRVVTGSTTGTSCTIDWPSGTDRTDTPVCNCSTESATKAFGWTVSASTGVALTATLSSTAYICDCDGVD